MISIAAALLALFAGCQRFANLDVDAFEALLQAERTFLLDVRTPEEFEAGHLPGAANADWQSGDFLQRVAELCPPERPLAVYCRAGVRGAAASKALSKAGYTVSNLAGGYLAWIEAGKPGVTSETPSREP